MNLIGNAWRMISKPIDLSKKHSMSTDHRGDRDDFSWRDMWSWTLYLHRLSADIRSIRSRFTLASCTLVCFEKNRWIPYDRSSSVNRRRQNCEDLSERPSRSTVILSSAYAVFHALSTGGSSFLGNYQNKKVLRQSLKNIAKKRYVFSRSLVN